MKKTMIPVFLTVLITYFMTGIQADCRQDAIVVVDSTEKILVLEEKPERIACLYAFCGHVVAMLGRGGDMTAIVNGLKKDMLLRKIVPEINNMPIPARGGIINIEALLRTEPDIVFLKPETAAISAEIKKLERFALPYFVAGYHSMAEQMTIIEMMGKTIGRKEKAFAYTRYYREVIQRVKSRTAHIQEVDKVRLYHSVNEPRRTDAPGTIEADWTRACGVTNVSLNARLKGKNNKYFADIEQIILWDPEIIIVNEEGVDRQILADKKWEAIRAVKNKKVLAIPVGISRWGHPGGLETPLALLWTAKTIYPDLFDDIDLKKEIFYFYKSFFNLDLDDVMIDRILSNEGMRQAI